MELYLRAPPSSWHDAQPRDNSIFTSDNFCTFICKIVDKLHVKYTQSYICDVGCAQWTNVNACRLVLRLLCLRHIPTDPLRAQSTRQLCCIFLFLYLPELRKGTTVLLFLLESNCISYMGLSYCFGWPQHFDFNLGVRIKPGCPRATSSALQDTSVQQRTAVATRSFHCSHRCVGQFR